MRAPVTHSQRWLTFLQTMFFLSLWNVHRPPFLDISFFAAADHSLSRSSTLQTGDARLPQLFSHRQGPCGCNTSAPMPVSVRYRPGRVCRRAHESRGLWLGALAPPSSRLSGSQLAIPHKEGRCPWLGPSSMAAPGCLGHLLVCCPQGDGQGCQRQAVPCRGCLLPPGFLGCCCSWPSRVNPSPAPTHPDPRVQAAINIY